MGRVVASADGRNARAGVRCVFQSCPMIESAHDALIMICFGKGEQWIETTRCLEASRVTACHFGHASQPPRAL